MTRHSRQRHRTVRLPLTLWIGSVLLVGCQQGAPVDDQAAADDIGPMTMPVSEAGDVDLGDKLNAAQATAARLGAIDAAVARWQAASDLRAARRAAEEARNLVEGPAGPDYGDADGDGSIAGSSSIGLLPGKDGEAGLAKASDGACVERDVLGGSWAEPGQRWAILKAAIADWSKSNNTFPALPSHPQRIVGWASLTLNSPDLATAREYGGHARIHIDVAKQAYSACKS